MKLFLAVALMLCVFANSAFAIKYIKSYTRNDGTYVSGHYRDTSNDGVQSNNANYLGWNK